MSNQKRKVTSWFISCAMLTTLLCAGYAAAENDIDNPQQQQLSQGEEQADEFEEPNYTPLADIEERLQSLKMPKLERKYLAEKYPGLKQIETFSNLKQTEYGPSGELDISGKIAPKGGWGSILEGKEGKEERARAIARAFLQEEAGLLGVVDIDEIKERKLVIGKGWNGDHIDIHYSRVINGMELKGSWFHVTIGPEESITAVDAKVLPLTPALYEAAAKRTIGKGKVFKIVKDSLTSSDPEVRAGVSKAQKEAILDPPYVIWNVEATSIKPAGGGMQEWQWEFKIDAFTGEIIQKRERPIDSVSDPLR